ncbi:1,2-phenylacetyl-CoA epoxidase subunit PaaD [Halogranum amylolyticum]|nr:1,2-phenylacetyl-CoA epoxidase subunit PaaD [Halogranum amylolyticum]
MESGAPVGSDACAYTDYAPGEKPEAFPKTGEGATGVEADIWEALYEVQDPEMPVSVVDLGLIYNVDVESEPPEGSREDGEAAGTKATVEMTLTYTGCPARDMILNDVRCAAMTAPGVDEAEVKLRYNPPWNVNMVTEQGREQLREFGLSV